MSGFLQAVYEDGKTFNNFFTAGAGGLIGLHLVAPRLENHVENLRMILQLAVADEIYRHLPVNYKVFRKNSPMMDPVQKWFNLWKLPPTADASRAKGRRIYNDLVDLWAVMATPGGWYPGAVSMCAVSDDLPKIVDLDKLKQFEGEYFYNAYNIDSGEIDLFGKDVLDMRHIKAGLAFPFIYPPGEVDGKSYFEGADVDPLNLFGLMDAMSHDEHGVHFHSEESVGHSIIVVDIMGSLEKPIVRKPKGLWDAYAMSIMTSIVGCTRWSKAMFRERYIAPDCRHLLRDLHPHQNMVHGSFDYDINCDPYGDPGLEDPENRHRVCEVRFEIPPSDWPEIMDWSYSNLERCYAIGLETGKAWLRGTDADGRPHRDLLPDRKGKSVNPVRS
jgi:hypothetical protein